MEKIKLEEGKWYTFYGYGYHWWFQYIGKQEKSSLTLVNIWSDYNTEYQKGILNQSWNGIEDNDIKPITEYEVLALNPPNRIRIKALLSKKLYKIFN